ncbi:MAG: PD-(D/E)XK nuclease-like domain-containing protein [Myxococcota bacterium]
MTWVDHEDYPCSIREHHEHPALGSTALRRLFTAEEPRKNTANLGNAVGWLAITERAQWDAPSAVVVQREDFRGRPEALKQWERDHPDVIGLTKAQMVEARELANALQAHPHIEALVGSLHVEHVKHEHTVIATHAQTGVVCKARPDFRVDGLRIDDIKITRESDPSDFARQVRQHWLHVQAALYHDIDCTRHGLTRLRDGYTIIAVSRATKRVAAFGLANWLDEGRKVLDAALRLAAYRAEGDAHVPTMWERPQQLPPPSRWDQELTKRIVRHVDRVIPR